LKKAIYKVTLLESYVVLHKPMDLRARTSSTTQNYGGK